MENQLIGEEDHVPVGACIATTQSWWSAAEPHLRGELKKVVSEGLAEMKEGILNQVPLAS